MTIIYLLLLCSTSYKVTSGNDEILRLKKRFLKEKSDRSSFFAKQMAKRNMLRKVNQGKLKMKTFLCRFTLKR